MWWWVSRREGGEISCARFVSERVHSVRQVLQLTCLSRVLSGRFMLCPPCPCCPALALMRAGTNPAALCFVVCTPALQEPAVVCFILLCFYFKNKMHIYRLSTCSQRRSGKGREHEWRCPLQMEATFCERVYDCMAMKSFCFGRKKPTELAKHNNEGCVVHQNTDEPWVGLEQQQKNIHSTRSGKVFFSVHVCLQAT